ncbi:MAG: dTDP-4-dehydrorhamnose 3,5-epimerase [Gammaproteobacteria bacterium RIFCSPLOWO2_02_FULL_61_13]|nr:MAG: dTDP-4-dehydrorhamnose 3,5-epimerase [Gammaproteobacteria bacterium RIFCSPLOWO2_02_FULL_61_13]
MEWISTAIPDVIHIRPDVYGDSRGHFKEVWNKKEFARRGIDVDFVQDNESRSRQGTLRGLHYQVGRPQGKLVRVLDGEVFDVAVDLRRSSPHFGKWVGMNLTADGHDMLWIPEGFAHGFYVLSESAILAYKCTDYYAPSQERTILWNDRSIGITWPLVAGASPLLSEKDTRGVDLAVAECF